MLTPEQIKRNLARIFTPTLTEYTQLTNDMAARTVFTMLYCRQVIGANPERWFSPTHLTTRLGETQAALTSDADCEAYYSAVTSNIADNRPTADDAWYRDNTRETIRKKVLTQGLIEFGAVRVRPNVPTNSPWPRYALAPDFAALFDSADPSDEAIEAWRNAHLTDAQRLRERITRQAQNTVRNPVQVQLPDGTTRTLSAGMSSLMIKAVVDDFIRYHAPGAQVAMISDTGERQAEVDAARMAQYGLAFDPAVVLPDMVLVQPSPLTVIFVEVVHSDGPVTEQRRRELMEIARGSRFEHVRFVTVFEIRNGSAARKYIEQVAWNTEVWYSTEPIGLIRLQQVNVPADPVV